MTLPVIVQGLGPIGIKILEAAHNDPGFDVVGAVDIDASLVGRDVSDVAAEGPSGVTVRASLEEAAEDAGADEAILLQATGSYLESVEMQIEDALRLRLHVVSTCEELSYPFVRHPEISERIDMVAVGVERTVVATGINPGFVMDQLAVAMTGATHAIRSVTVRRVQDPSPRRVPFQRKVGMGISREEYDALAASGKFGHVGLVESGRLLAAGLGWEIDNWSDTLEAVQPDAAGPVLGTLQILTGSTTDGKSVRLHFEAQSGVAESYDEVEIDGTPPLKLRFEGGVFGDDATAAAVLRAARVIPSTARGLLTVLDLPLRARPDPGY